jgi:hypothetical protein
MLTTKQLKKQAVRRQTEKWLAEIKAHQAAAAAWAGVVKDASGKVVDAVKKSDTLKATLARAAAPVKAPRNRFFIFVPDYYPCSGGSRTMHYMAALLVDAGVPVVTNKLCFFNPTIPVEQIAQDGDVAVYYDGVRSTDNPLCAKRVCRWMLCFAEEYFKGKIKKEECAIIYMKKYLASVQAACHHPVTEEDIIYLPHIDPAWCFAPSVKTIKYCFYGAGAASKTCVAQNPKLHTIQPPPGAVVIPGFVDKFPDDQGHDQFFVHQRTVAILRASETLWTVDHNTALNIEAALCGCRVIYLFDDGSYQEQFFPREVLELEAMNPQRDVAVARRFADRVLKFFGESL